MTFAFLAPAVRMAGRVVSWAGSAGACSAGATSSAGYTHFTQAAVARPAVIFWTGRLHGDGARQEVWTTYGCCCESSCENRQYSWPCYLLT